MQLVEDRLGKQPEALARGLATGPSLALVCLEL